MHAYRVEVARVGSWWSVRVPEIGALTQVHITAARSTQ
jgi:hypothetical protein